MECLVKHAFYCAFKDDEFNSDHVPTVFDTYVAEIEVDGKTVSESIIIPHGLFCINILLIG